MTILPLILAMILVAPAAAASAPEGQLTWAVHFTIAPIWLDPAEGRGAGARAHRFPSRLGALQGRSTPEAVGPPGVDAEFEVYGDTVWLDTLRVGP